MKRTMMVVALVVSSSVCSQTFGFDLLDRMLGLKGSGCDSTCCDTGIVDPCCEPVCGVDAGCCGAAGCGGACGEPVCGVDAGCCGVAGCGDACCEPVCGVDAGFGGVAGCGSACGEPVCGIEAGCCEPACGVASCDTGCGHHRGGLLTKLFGGLNHMGCDSCCEPICGIEATACCEPACGYSDPCCDTGCGCGHKPRLLDLLFGGLNKGCCDTACDAYAGASCGCTSGGAYSVPSSTAPAAPIEVQADDAPMPPAPVVDPSAYLNTKRRVIQASTRYVR